MKTNEKEFLLDIARLAANRSHAVRLKVGAVVSDTSGNIIAAGFNGTIKGFHTNSCEVKNYQSDSPTHIDKDGIGYALVTDEATTIHAEQNLISHAARRGISINGGIVFSTHSPCAKCCSLLIQCGISEMIFLEEHRSFDAVQSLYGSYIKLIKWN